MVLTPLQENELLSLIFSNNIINISGESGTGKTTLALYLVGNFLTSQRPYEHSCVWVQANDLFPKKRLFSLFSLSEEKLEYLKNNIYVIPERRPISSYREQAQLLQKLIDSESILPPDLKCIVIDNISHHLRFELSTCSEILNITNTIDSFFDELLLPLLLFCRRENIHLLLVHEVSFDIDAEQQRPFLHKLYSRLDVLHIHLLKLFNSQKKKIRIISGEAQWVFFYMIENSRFVWC